MTATEAYCLKKILAGFIRQNETGEVELWHENHKVWLVKKPAPRKKDGRLLYSFSVTNGKVYASRLIWMIEHKQEIPDTHFVDHKNESRHDNSISNLTLMPVGESHQQGYRIQADSILDYLSRWFQFLGSYGREPLTELELLYVNTGF